MSEAKNSHLIHYHIIQQNNYDENYENYSFKQVVCRHVATQLPLQQ